MGKLNLLAVLASLLCFTASHIISQNSGEPNTDCTTENWLVNFTIVTAQKGRYDDAREELKKDPNYHLLMDQIVRKLYNGSVNDIQTCLNLFYNISCTAYAAGLSAMFEEMEKYNHLLKPHVLVVARYISIDGCKDSKIVKQIGNDLRPFVDYIISEWAEDIHNGTFAHIYAFGQFSPKHRQFDALNMHITKLVKRSMDRNIQNFQATFKFIQASGYLGFDWKTVLTITQELIELFSDHSEEMMQVAHWFSNIMIKNAKSVSSDAWKDKCTKAKQTFPLDMQNLFWNKNCTVKNLFWNEELSADIQHDSAFTLNSDILTENQWIVEHTLINNKLFFLFKHPNSKNPRLYLCQPSHSTNVTLCSGRNRENWHKWKLTPVMSPNCKPAFLIWRSLSGGYLQATKEVNAETKQRIIQGSHLDRSSYWQFSCV